MTRYTTKIKFSGAATAPGRVVFRFTAPDTRQAQMGFNVAAGETGGVCHQILTDVINIPGDEVTRIAFGNIAAYNLGQCVKVYSDYKLTISQHDVANWPQGISVSITYPWADLDTDDDDEWEGPKARKCVECQSFCYFKMDPYCNLLQKAVEPLGTCPRFVSKKA